MSDHADLSGRKPGRCPICARPPGPGFRPFCSKRCADVDLGRWLTEAYRAPAPPEPSVEEE